MLVFTLCWREGIILKNCVVQVVFQRLYPKDYTAAVSTRVSNALLVGTYQIECVVFQEIVG